MSIAPRFTPSIGNVGSAPIPKAQANPTSAVAFDTLAKVVGNAATVAEKIAAKQDAYDRSVAAHQMNLLDAKDDSGWQKFSSEPLDPQKLDDNDYVKDDGVAEHRAALNSPKQQEYFDLLVAPYLIRRKTRIAAHVQNVLQKSSLEATSLQLERQQEIASTDLDNESISQVQSLARSRAIIAGYTPEVADQHAENATDDVMYNHIKLVAETRNYRETIARYEKLKGQFGSRELEAQAVVKNAQDEVDTDEALGQTIVKDGPNIDAAKTFEKSSNEAAKLDPAKKKLLTAKAVDVIRMDAEERKAIGVSLHNDLDRLMTSGVDQTSGPIGRGGVVWQLNTFLSENRDRVSRAPEEVRKSLEERIKNPDKSNIRHKAVVRTLIAGANNGDLDSTRMLMDTDLDAMVLSVSDRQEAIDAKTKYRLGGYDDSVRKKREAIADALERQGRAKPNYRKMADDNALSIEEQAQLDEYNKIIDAVMTDESAKKNLDEAVNRVIGRHYDVKSKGWNLFSAGEEKADIFAYQSEAIARFGEQRFTAEFAKQPTNASYTKRVSDAVVALENQEQVEAARKENDRLKQIEASEALEKAKGEARAFNVLMHAHQETLRRLVASHGEGSAEVIEYREKNAGYLR